MFPLIQNGVLGINRRNIELIARNNPRHLYPLVDDKLLTKRMCLAKGIPTPRLLARAQSHFELESLSRRLDELDDFVMKPSRGAMGNGIIVITGRDGKDFLKASGKALKPSRLRHHASSILSGLYALSGQDDRVLIEERLRVHPELAKASFGGVPDVRVIIYKGYPVMAMARLPTARADGRANLHQGAVGVGIDVATGRGVAAIQNNRAIPTHPDTGLRLAGMLLPFYDDILAICVQAADETGLGYLGADIVVDEARGPVLLELNARPGLSVQICNRQGLIPRLRDVEVAEQTRRSPHERIAWSRERALVWRSKSK